MLAGDKRFGFSVIGGREEGFPPCIDEITPGMFSAFLMTIPLSFYLITQQIELDNCIECFYFIAYMQNEKRICLIVLIRILAWAKRRG